MKAVDPKIKVIAVGAPGKWNDAILAPCAGHMDLLSMHHYTERKFRVPLSPQDAEKYEKDFATYSGKVLEGVRGLVNDMRRRLGKDARIDAVRLCIDEWGIVREWNPAPDACGVGAFEHYYTIGDAVAVARALNELLRSADLVGMAMWPQTVNVIGAIKTTRNHAALDPVGHVQALYRAHVNGTLVPLNVPAGATLDAVAALDKKTGILSLGLVNFSPNQDVAVSLRFGGAARLDTAAAWRINGPALGSFNTPGKPEDVTTTKLAEPLALDKPIVLPAHSITVLETRLQGQ
jgi:alpha-N-arabinofuranosidase